MHVLYLSYVPAQIMLLPYQEVARIFPSPCPWWRNDRNSRSVSWYIISVRHVLVISTIHFLYSILAVIEVLKTCVSKDGRLWRSLSKSDFLFKFVVKRLKIFRRSSSYLGSWKRCMEAVTYKTILSGVTLWCTAVVQTRDEKEFTFWRIFLNKFTWHTVTSF